jgi:hypothetical protein
MNIVRFFLIHFEIARFWKRFLDDFIFLDCIFCNFDLTFWVCELLYFYFPTRPVISKRGILTGWKVIKNVDCPEAQVVTVGRNFHTQFATIKLLPAEKKENRMSVF